jgi:hypothetical protein
MKANHLKPDKYMKNDKDLIFEEMKVLSAHLSPSPRSNNRAHLRVILSVPSGGA